MGCPASCAMTAFLYDTPYDSLRTRSRPIFQGSCPAPAISVHRWRARPSLANSTSSAKVPADLSPFFHPAMSRALVSFEPVWLGDATGRGAELKRPGPL